MLVFTIFFIGLVTSSLSVNCTSTERVPTTASFCGDLGDCTEDVKKCDNRCGCTTAALVLFYNETLDGCEVNVKRLLQTLTEKYNTSERIYKEVDRVFQGIVISVLLFITCAGICFITACIYCCRISYMDHEMRDDVEALADKLKRDCRFRKTIPKPATKPVEQSCNVMVEGAGIYVV